MSVEAGVLLFLIGIPIYVLFMCFLFWAEKPYTDEEKKIYDSDNALIKFIKKIKS